MKKYLFFVFLILFFTDVFSFPAGVALRTRKTTTLGCGNCHIFGTSLTGSFSGPDSVNTGQTVQFTLQYSGTNAGLYGVDIAARYGTLAPGSSSAYLKILSEELVQKAGLTVTALTFNYTAPSTPGIDSLFATIDKGEPGVWNWVPEKRIIIRLPAAIKNESGIVSGYKLNQNYPNPFNPETTIKFELPYTSFVNLSIYNLIGEKVATLVNEQLEQGVHFINFKGNNLASGLYVFRLSAGEVSFTKTMMLLK